MIERLRTDMYILSGFTIVLMVIGFSILIMYDDSGIAESNRDTINEYTNHSIKGVYTSSASILIPLNRINDKGLKRTLDHEYVHYQIRKNKTCGSEGCYEHFCK